MSGERISLVGWIGLCLGVGVAASLATDVGLWYANLDKPRWTPPNWLFAPVWTTLYILMGIAAWLVWQKRQQKPVHQALGLFLLQLALNGLWSVLFFRLHWVGWAGFELWMLWIVLILTIIAFFRVRFVAGGLLLPYLAWVSYAAALNTSIWTRNGAFPT